MAGWPPERQVFVTVGTTEFDALIEAVDSDAAHAALAALGYTRVLFQVGRGSARPRGPAGSRSSRLPTACFDFAPSLDEHVGASALVISHAGAGSIMDALGRRKPLVKPMGVGIDHQEPAVGGLERACGTLLGQRIWPNPGANVTGGKEVVEIQPHQRHTRLQHGDVQK